MKTYNMPIFVNEQLIDLNRYTSNRKKDAKYKETVDLTLTTLSKNLGIPFLELYNGLFFAKGTLVKGMLVLE